MFRRILGCCLIAAIGLTSLTGCTGSRDKGRNKDLDRPHTSQTHR